MEKKDANGKTYYYLDFVDNAAQNEYVKCIAQNGYLEGLFKSKGLSYTNDDIVEMNAIKATIEMGLARFFDKNTEIKIASGATVYTSGTLFTGNQREWIFFNKYFGNQYGVFIRFECQH